MKKIITLNCSKTSLIFSVIRIHIFVVCNFKISTGMTTFEIDAIISVFEIEG